MSRPIDADALLKALVRKEPFSDCARVVIAECMEEVRHAPPIEPERKKGKWNWVGFNIECPECGFMPIFDSTEPLYKFCPNCGSPMDGGEQE